MASGEFMRVVPEALPLKVYGFKKVSKVQLESIVNRLTRQTHSTESQLISGDLWNYSSTPPQAPFRICARSPSFDDGTKRGQSPKTISERNMDKVIRRLQRPTISTMAADGSIAPSYELEFTSRAQLINLKRPNTADEQQKLLERIQRPTTASRRKLYGHSQCLLCEDLQCSAVHTVMKTLLDTEQMRCSSRPASFRDKGHLRHSNSQRAHSATHASTGGGTPCLRKSESRNKTPKKEELPLISGLRKSENVQEITRRLHPKQTSRSQSRASLGRLVTRVPAATPIVVEG